MTLFRSVFVIGCFYCRRRVSVSTSILIIEDDAAYARVLSRVSSGGGFDSVVASSGEEGLRILEDVHPAVVLVDLGLPGIDGIKVIEDVSRRLPGAISIVVSGLATVETAVSAMRAGAFDIIQKTGDLDEVSLRLEKAFETVSLRRQVEYLASRERSFGEIVGDSEEMREVRRRIEDVASAPNATVLIVGETGTGKELVARAVHRLSPRAKKLPITVNCAAVPENLIESEFFGHEKGAFTGAERVRSGMFEMASGSSLFLDEIGELDPRVQVKLLRVLEERVVKRVGGNREIPVDVRLILATNRDLEREVAEGRFREDLLYRINVFKIDVPPLRERGNDVLLLARHFMLEFARQLGKKVNVIEPSAERLLLRYPFPGNVRQLRNVMEQAVILARGDAITPDLLPALGPTEADTTVTIKRHMEMGEGTLIERMALIERRRTELDDFEKDLILEAMKESRTNKTKAARLLGVSRFALQRRIKKLEG